MPRVIIAGSINMDVVAATARFPQPGETVAGSAIAFHPGGKGGNQAVAAAKLGARTLLIGRVGLDAFGEQLRAFLAGQGVDISHVTAVDGATGTAVITTAGAQNCIVVVPGANAALDEAGVTAVPIRAGDVLLSQFEVPRPAVNQFFQHGKRAGATTILNPSPAAAIDALLLDDTDIIVLNETELAFLTRAALNGSTPDDAVLAAARTLRGNRLQQIICVTLGPRGVIALAGSFDGDRVISIPGRKVEAIDSTGAGDCFTGALAASLAQGSSLETALRLANDAAAVSVQRHGAGPSMPTPADIAALRAGASSHAA
jgi:ribokinase